MTRPRQRVGEVALAGVILLISLSLAAFGSRSERRGWFDIGIPVIVVMVVSLAAFAGHRRSRTRPAVAIGLASREVGAILAIIVLTTAAMLAEYRFGFPRTGVQGRWEQAVGGVLAVAALALLRWSYLEVGAGHSGGLAWQPGAPVATRGPYAFVRHPQFLAYVLLVASFAFSIWPGLVVTVAGILGLLEFVAPIEEARTFESPVAGDYRVYASKTKNRVLPYDRVLAREKDVRGRRPV